MQRNSSGMHPACAACKHQRKKCSENCILAPYFPSNRSREFHAVHKVFGVSNITKLVKNAREDDRRRVVDSLTWEACCRQRDPIHGPYGEYTKVFNEYKKVLDELKRFRSQHQMLQFPSLGFKSLQDKAEEDYLHGTKNAIIDSDIYNSYCSNYLQEFQNLRPEVLIPFQHHSQPYYITGDQFKQ
ncbi:LOB domain-containing protein 2-like [Vigna umbellata]|uniref:LOB domain-containing protein 2-like n=1 Tax=Vigna umbellata TaxID=87088 RepID=UPI001F5F5179|nr:LOB domain-containing protein 2-like [Vigna umbellata]